MTGQSDTMPLVVDAVSFSYESERVLSDCSLAVAPHERVMLTGENGAGKSTLVGLVTGRLRPSQGSVTLFGQDPRHMRSWARVGFLSQGATESLAGMPATVQEVVRSGLYAGSRRLVPIRGWRESVSAALERCGIADLALRPASQLSGGQRQRVLLARALVNNPDLLVLDEPTAALDPDAADEMFALLSPTAAGEGPAALVITHDAQRARQSGCRIVRLENGHMEEL